MEKELPDPALSVAVEVPSVELVSAVLAMFVLAPPVVASRTCPMLCVCAMRAFEVLAPPVSSAASKLASPESKPTRNFPAAIALQVP